MTTTDLAAVGMGPAPRTAAWPSADPWWRYLGGPLGSGLVGLAAPVVRRLGVLRLGFALSCGQLVGALLLDLLAPLGDAGTAPLTLLGVGLTLAAIAIAIAVAVAVAIAVAVAVAIAIAIAVSGRGES